MLKTIALIGLTAAIVAPPASAFAQTGYGVTPGSRPPRLSTVRGTKRIKTRNGREPARPMSVTMPD